MVAKPIRDDVSARDIRGLAKRERDGRIKARLLAIAACQEGMSRKEAAALTGMSRNVLRIWIDRYNARGLAGLRDRKSPGRTPRIPAEKGARLRQRVLAGPDPERDGVVAFRIVDIQRIAEEEFDIEASFTTIWREMKRQRLSWLSPRPQNPRADAQTQEDFKKKFRTRINQIAQAHPEAERLEIWFQDEARVGQKGTLTRVWAETASRPRAARDARYNWLYIFGAICPHEDKGAALIMPCVNAQAMHAHLETISQGVAKNAHAVVVLDRAGWHTTKRLSVPSNITLLPLPPRSPELNPQENVWAYLRKTKLSNRTFDTADKLMEVCCEAWNALLDEPGRIRSIGSFPWITKAQSL